MENIKKLVIAEKTKAAKALVAGLYKKDFQFVEPYKKFKPPKSKAGYFESDDVIVVYASGHLLRLKTVEEYLGLPASPRNYDCLPFIPKNFELVVEDDEWTQVQFKIISELLKRKDINEVVHFGDPDNEGELIIREILSYLGNNLPVKRLWCNSMVPEVVAEAYYNLEDDKKYTNIYMQALARQRFDFLWGINISRFLTKKAGQNFPAGRVLVPIVKYIYDRDKEIDEFCSVTSYGIKADVSKGDWKTSTVNITPKVSFTDKSQAEVLASQLNKLPKIVASYEEKNKKKYPKKLFNLSSFQSQFNKNCGCDLKKSLEIVQKLYEKGFTTYPRTSVEYLSSKETREMEKVITKLIAAGHSALSFDPKASVFNDDKCVGGHTALTITTKIPTEDDVNNMSELEKQAYCMILNRTLSNFCEPLEYLESKVVIECGEYTVQITGNKLLSEGFSIYEETPLKDQIPSFSIGESVDINFIANEQETSPPPKITPELLLKFLANPYQEELKEINKEDDTFYYNLLKTGATLGTEATTAQIVENAQKHGYIVLKKKAFSITEKGVAFIKLLDTFGINLYKEKNIEMNMEITAIGTKAYLLEECKQKIAAELQDIVMRNENSNVVINADLFNDSLGVCPKCGEPVIEKKNSFQCTNKNCKFFLYKEDKYFKSFGKTITPSIAKSLLDKKQVRLNKLKAKSGKEYSIIISADFSGDFPKYSTSFPKNKR